MTDWSFRYRFKLGAGMSIAADSPELLLTEQDASQRVGIRSIAAATGDPGVPISAQPNLVLRGSGFATREDAQIAAVRWLNALLLGFAANNLGADFALRNPESVVPLHNLQDYVTETHPVVLPDDHRLMIFETNPPPLFVKLDIGAVTVRKGTEHLLKPSRLRMQTSPRSRNGTFAPTRPTAAPSEWGPTHASSHWFQRLKSCSTINPEWATREH